MKEYHHPEYVAIDIIGRNGISFITKKGGRLNGSILYEMPNQKGNEEG